MDKDAVYTELKQMKERLVELAVMLDEDGKKEAACSLDDAYTMIREAQMAIVERRVD